MGWLDEHMETFVRPTLASIQEKKTQFVTQTTTSNPRNYFTQEEMTVIKNAWRSTKKAAQGKKILLAGRDVFIFEILARRENYPTTFIPECSRATVKWFWEHGNFSDHFLFDTGFAGSIPRGLGIQDFKLLSFAQRDSVKQTFPKLTWSRHLALKIEKTPKYWESGRIDAEGEVIQPFTAAFEFYQAAMLTIEVYTNSAPKFIKKHKPIIPANPFADYSFS